MSLPMILFVLLASGIIFLLVWATRPPKLIPLPLSDFFELLSQPRHCARIHFILQSLQPEDTIFLREAGRMDLMRELRAQRRQIALRYLDCLEEEFETHLEISRAIAVMAPEVVAIEEMARWKLSLLFSLKCAALRWRLRLGFRSMSGLNALSTLATGMLRHLEAATSTIAEHAATTGNFAKFNLMGRDTD